jgi:hypothetical protein
MRFNYAMPTHRRPQTGDIVTAYRIRHPFKIYKVFDDLEAVVLEYPNGEFTRLIPLDAIEYSEETAKRCWISLTEPRDVQRLRSKN